MSDWFGELFLILRCLALRDYLVFVLCVDIPIPCSSISIVQPNTTNGTRKWSCWKPPGEVVLVVLPKTKRIVHRLNLQFVLDHEIFNEDFVSFILFIQECQWPLIFLFSFKTNIKESKTRGHKYEHVLCNRYRYRLRRSIMAGFSHVCEDLWSIMVILVSFLEGKVSGHLRIYCIQAMQDPQEPSMGMPDWTT